MGSSLVIRTHPPADRDTIKKFVRNEQDRATSESGRSYSGEWNMCNGVQFLDQVFADTDAAETYIGDKAQKWENLLAVRATALKELTQKERDADATLAELVAQRASLQSDLSGMNSAVVRRAREAKSEYRTCKGCGSSLSVKHLQHICCPLCRGPLLWTATDDAKKLALTAKLEAAGQRVLKQERKLLGKKFPGVSIDEPVWVIGGWCAC